MTSLFKYERLGGVGSLQFWNEIVKLASTHARSLGGFALVYKAAQSVIGASTGLPRTNPLMSMVPAFAIGAWIWGFKNSVSEQFNMYLLSRVLWPAARAGRGIGQRSKWRHSASCSAR